MVGTRDVLARSRHVITRFVLAASMLIVGAGVGAGAFSVLASHGDSNVIHACVDNETGDVRIVENPDKCQTTDQGDSRNRRDDGDGPERLVEWNKQGPQGVQGPQGPPGDAAGLPVASCAEGETLVGFGENGQLLCEPGAPAVPPDQTCAAGETVTGFDAEGNVLCASDEVGSLPVQSCAAGEALIGFDANGELVCDDVDDLLLRDCSDVTIEPEANLSNCDLRGANLQFEILFYVDLSNANLTDADLSYANLTGADLSGANLTGAILTGVTWDNTTCPDGTNSYDNDGDGLTCLNNLEP